MPPKIVRPKAKSQMSKNAKNSKVFKKPFKLEPIVEEKTEEEEKAVEEVPPKKVSWLDTLHWSPPPDQELHNQLSKQRREQTHKKHFNYCHEEIHAILNYAFATRKLTDPKAIRRERIAFEKGFYIPKEEETHEQINVSVKEKMIKQRTKSKLFEDHFNADELFLEPDTVAMNKFMHYLHDQDITNYQIPAQYNKRKGLNTQRQQQENQGQENENEKKEIEFDANPEGENMLKIASEGSKKYTETVPTLDKQPLPYIISIIGGQCTGKTTIAQYIQYYFNVKVLKYVPNTEPCVKNNIQIISSSDDKQIPQIIADYIVDLEEGQGLVIVGYPNSKVQLNLLEKAFASKEIPSMAQIHGLIKTDFSNADSTIRNRLIDVNSGMIFNPTFFMPSFISFDFSKAAKLEQYPVSNIDANNAKLLNNIQFVEKSLKKQAALCTVPFCQFISELIEIIQQFLHNLTKPKNKEESNIQLREPRFKSQQEFLFAKFCYEVFQQWTNICMPEYCSLLGKAYSQLMSVKTVVHKLRDISYDKFILKMNCRDERNKIIPAILKNHLENTNETNMFNSIWDQTTKLRKENLEEAKEIISTIGFTTIEPFNIEKFKNVFKGIIKRYCIIFWFVDRYKNALNSSDIPPPEIEMMNIPSFDINNFVSISDAMYVDAFGKGTRPPEFCVKREIPKIVTKVSNINIDDKQSSEYSTENQTDENQTNENNEQNPNSQDNENGIPTKLSKGILQSSHVVKRFSKENIPPSMPSSCSVPASLSSRSELIEKSVTFETDLILDKHKEEQKEEDTQNSSEKEEKENIPSKSPSGSSRYNDVEYEESHLPPLNHDVELIDRGFPQTIDWSGDQKQLEEIIRKYLTYTRDTNPNPSMMDEANLLLCAFNAIMKDKNDLEQYLEVERVELEKEFNDIAQKKYQNEMEHFSQNTLHEMNNQSYEGPLFTFDHTSIQGHLAHLCGIIGGIPDPQKPRCLNYISIERLVNACDGLKSHLNICQLDNLALKAGLTIRQRAELELIARMETNPFVIDPIVLCSYINAPQPVPKRRAQSSFN